MKKGIGKTISIIVILTMIFQLILPMISELNIKVLAADEITADLEISTKEELIAFANDVNNGNTYEEKTVVLTADIDLEGNENNQWTPIGNDSYAFEGTFDGRNHIISNLYISDSNNLGKGFFSDNNGTIKNLNISSGTVIGNEANDWGVGGLVGTNRGIIENVETMLDIHGTETNIGGIVGSNSGEMRDSVSNGSVSLNAYISYNYVGGIVGKNSGTIFKCNNNSDVIIDTDELTFVGGIVGLNNGIVKESINEARIENREYVGGIVGCNKTTQYDNIVIDCINNGNVRGKRFIGGICGDNTSGIKDCLNYGKIESTINRGNSDVGGISGQSTIVSENSMAIIVNCHNYGNVEGADGVAGIVATTGGKKEKVFVKRCNNYGEIISHHKNEDPENYEYTASEIAGIVQSNGGNLIDCINFGNIKGVVSAGGIISSNQCGTVNRCANYGSVTTSIGKSNGVSRTGAYNLVSAGIAVLNYSGEIYNCYSKGEISSEVRDGLNISPKVMGLIYQNDGSITNCYTISQLNTAKTVNIINTNTGTISNCYYLKSTYTGNVLNNIISKDSNFMKTEDFVNLLNNSDDVFVLDSENKNDGYPVFNDEKDEIVISLKDKNFYNSLLDKIGIFIYENNDDSLEINILEEDIEYITELDLSDKEINNITGLENLTSLTTLNLKRNNITDIECLKDLEKLEILNLSWNNIRDISSLNNLKKLTNLDLSFNKIIDITPLNGLIELERLDLKYNNLKEIPILDCENLKYLNLQTNNLTDITNLSSLKNLEEVYFDKLIQGSLEREGNKIDNIEVVKELKNLKKFGAWNNCISDVSVLEEISDISGYNVSNQALISNGEIGEEISLPKIFLQAQNKESKAYSEEGLQVYNCKLNEDGTKIILTLHHSSTAKKAMVTINEGILKGSTFTIEVNEKDEVSPILTVNYSTKNPTRENVKVTITSNEEIQGVEGWTLSSDKKTLTKEYSANAKETITIKDLVGNETQVIIEINNIEEEPEIVIGDINQDGKKDVTDFLMLKRHLVAGNKVNWILTGNYFLASDMNEDGNVDITDMLMLKRIIVENM